MRRNLIILTKSAKYGAYCVAGIDEENLQIIRLVSKDEHSKGALTDTDILYPDGTYMEVFDRVTVEVIGNENLWYQPENYIINRRIPFKYRGKASLDQIQKAVMCPEYIFYDNQKSILKEDILSQTNRVSLQFVEVPIVVLRRDDFDQRRITISFKYNGSWYNYIKLTDGGLTRKYCNRLGENEHYTLYNVLIVFSLAGEYEGRHYKLIANIIEQDDFTSEEVAVTFQEMNGDEYIPDIEWNDIFEIEWDDELPF